MTAIEDETMKAAEAMLRSVTSLIRWASRPENRDSLKGSGLIDPTSPRGWILARLDENDAVRVTDLATWLSVDKSTVTPQVAALEAMGYLTRRPDPSDGRAQQIVITTLGRRTHRATMRAGQKVFAQMLEDWTPQDRAALAHVGGLLEAELKARMNSSTR